MTVLKHSNSWKMSILYYTVHVLIVAFATDIAGFVEETSLPPPKTEGGTNCTEIFSSVDAYERQLRVYGSK